MAMEQVHWGDPRVANLGNKRQVKERHQTGEDHGDAEELRALRGALAVRHPVDRR